MKKGTFKFLLFAIFCGFCAFGATAATSLFSNYGQIQNVQNYSTNPFWTPNSPYNQRLPQPVYVQGADLTAEDCFKVVQSLVSAQCLARDNCKDTTLADIRPTIMVQLSNLPGNNYVSACSGYIDGVFESYVAQFGNNTPNRVVAFPTATEPNTGINNNNNIQIQNPYKKEIPQWQQEIKERSQEIQELEQQNGAGSEQLSVTDFPTTYDDLSFDERIALKSADYAQYKDKNAYVVPDFKNKKEWCEGKGADTAECKGYEKQQLSKNNQQKQVGPKDKKDNKQNIYGADYILPWYGILVVKKGSLDKVYNSDKPFIAPSYMKENKAAYFPSNSDKTLGITKGCTHGNHTANDNDVINRAAHKTMAEEDSFWTGNDYYVYDGEDVYWGTAALLGEVALAILTMGASAEAETLHAAKISKDVATVGKSIKAVNLVRDTQKVQDAAAAASAITKTSSAAEKAAAIKKLSDAGINVSNKVGYLQLNKIGHILSSTKKVGWVSALVTGNKWRLVKNGVKNIAPTSKKIFGTGATLGRRLAATTLVVGGAGAAIATSDTTKDFFVSILKANGYSSATVPVTDNPQYKNIEFNSFGLLSADNIEDHDNDISHGTWVRFDVVGESYSGDAENPGDAENEASRFAQEFAKDVREINKEDPLCDIDIFVVRPFIGDPLNKGKKDIYYLLYTDPTETDKPLRVESRTK